MGIISLILTPLLVVMIAAPMMIMAAEPIAEPTVNLGTTSTFAVLASSTITNTGTTTINGIKGGEVDGNVGGDLGLFPGTAFTGNASVTITNGHVYLTNKVASKAKDDLVTAYIDAAGRKPSIIPSELGGTTLKPGVYHSADGTFKITGTLILDAQGDPDGVFIFQTDSTLITASASNVEVINSARYCRTFWKVGSSATLGTNSHFTGHIFAMASITANTGATVQGQLLARTGAVTLDNNIIENGYCKPITTPAPTTTQAPAILHVIKHVNNDNGGKAVAADFKLHVKTSGGDIDVAPGVESPGTTYTLAAGTYTVSEDAFTGYTASFSGNSDPSGNITLVAGEEKTVMITNDDIAVSPVVTPIVTGVTPTVTAVTPTTTPVTTTTTGGQLPKTSSHLYEFLLAGVVLALIGSIGWISRKRYE